ncbi:hypothetical protein [Azospirillum sp.]|uniref:hypothetical protein n=1 Tax=Azospirillum sp. TaxID=34012 RepID=UPI003D715144
MKARKKLILGVMGAAALLLSGCANPSKHMLNVSEPAVVSTPAPDKATLVFLRPSLFGGAIQSPVFDVTDGAPQFVGIVSASTKLAYASPPGKRRLMVVGENAGFLDAELGTARTYYARVEPQMGIWKARFVLEPVPASTSALAGELNNCKWVENGPTAGDWARENMPSVKAKMANYLPDWEKQATKPALHPEDGR